ncbi:MAG: cheD-1 [Comamonadaceae bacterium]|nr:MAG: cheD-1 [Comamonadaceae bacterium]
MSRLPDLMDIFLQPGELFVADAGFQIRTILGSCVSITLWHPVARMGGMSHFLLPSRGKDVQEHEFDGRYGDEALLLMIKDLNAAGIDHMQCQAKIFGGGNMFPGHTRANNINVGLRNGEAARALLQRHGIEVHTENLYGEGHRQIIFNVSNGDVWSRQVRPSRLESSADHYAVKGIQK